MRTQYDQADVERVIEHLATEVAEAFKPEQPLSIIGIRTRGEVLAQRITQRLRARGFNHIGRGVLDITLYRDDLEEAGAKAVVQPTEVDFDINAQPMLLVDDVLFTGRSIR
jgi:pyrimidine operon attenuation protein/uracil phosphoribosyltransferase